MNCSQLDRICLFLNFMFRKSRSFLRLKGTEKVRSLRARELSDSRHHEFLSLAGLALVQPASSLLGHASYAPTSSLQRASIHGTMPLSSDAAEKKLNSQFPSWFVRGQTWKLNCVSRENAVEQRYWSTTGGKKSRRYET